MADRAVRLVGTARDDRGRSIHAGIAGLIIVAAIVRIAMFADFEHDHRINRVTVQEAAN